MKNVAGFCDKAMNIRVYCITEELLVSLELLCVMEVVSQLLPEIKQVCDGIFQAIAVMQLKFPVFWYVTAGVRETVNRSFETARWSHLQGSQCLRRNIRVSEDVNTQIS